MTDNENSIDLSESDARRLAQLARIHECSFSRFCELLVLEIETAHLANKHLTGEIVRAPDVKDCLDCVATAARALDKALAAFVGEGEGPAAAPSAGLLLELALNDAAGKDVRGFMPRLAAYRGWLGTLITAGDDAVKRVDGMFPPKRERGRPPNLVFNHFVYRLYEIVRQTGGEDWTHYRKSYGNWSGTLMQALDLLRDHLPVFFPESDLGYALERLSKDVMKRLTEEYGPNPAENKLMH